MIAPASVTYAHLLKTACDKLNDPRGGGIAEGFVDHLYKTAALVERAPAGSDAEVLAYKAAFVLAVSRKDKAEMSSTKMAADDATASTILGKLAEAVIVERSAAATEGDTARNVQKLSQEYILELAGALLA